MDDLVRGYQTLMQVLEHGLWLEMHLVPSGKVRRIKLTGVRFPEDTSLSALEKMANTYWQFEAEDGELNEFPTIGLRDLGLVLE